MDLASIQVISYFTIFVQLLRKLRREVILGYITTLNQFGSLSKGFLKFHKPYRP